MNIRRLARAEACLFGFLVLLSGASCVGGSGATDGGSGDGGDGGGNIIEPLPIDSANVFFSGHSLINLHVPWMTQNVSAALGKTVRYQSQIGNGSTMDARRSNPYTTQQKDGTTFLGCASAGQCTTAALASEIEDSQTLGGGQKFDHLVVTEAHQIYAQIMYSSSISNLDWFHDRLKVSNAGGRVYLYESWYNIFNQPSEPWNPGPWHYAIPGFVAGDTDDWQEATTADLFLWECLATKAGLMNGDADAIQVLPASKALVDLMEEVQAGNVPYGGGLLGREDIFGDGVHLTDLGNYYVSLVVHASLFRTSPEGAPHSGIEQVFGGGDYPDIGADTAGELQRIAWASVQDYYREDRDRTPEMPACDARMQAICVADGGDPGYCSTITQHFVD